MASETAKKQIDKAAKVGGSHAIVAGGVTAVSTFLAMIWITKAGADMQMWMTATSSFLAVILGGLADFFKPILSSLKNYIVSKLENGSN